jgi:hypothetical protein
MSVSPDQSSDDEEVLPEPRIGGPDITFSKTNGKHLKIEMDPIEWIIVGVFVTIITGILATTGVI